MTATTAHETLALTLAQHAEAGRIPPCAGDPELWLSEDEADRTHAATRCARSCPVVPECAAAAAPTRERFGVWAGVDLTPRRKETA